MISDKGVVALLNGGTRILRTMLSYCVLCCLSFGLVGSVGCSKKATGNKNASPAAATKKSEADTGKKADHASAAQEQPEDSPLIPSLADLPVITKGELDPAAAAKHMMQLFMEGDLSNAAVLGKRLLAMKKLDDEAKRTVKEIWKILERAESLQKAFLQLVKNKDKSSGDLVDFVKKEGEAAEALLRGWLYQCPDLKRLPTVLEAVDKLNSWMFSGVLIHQVMQAKTKEGWEPAANLLKKLAEKHSAVADELSTAGLLRLALYLPTVSDKEKASAIRNIIQAWKLEKMPRSFYKDLCDGLKDDKTLTKRYAIEVLCALYQQVGHNEAKFKSISTVSIEDVHRWLISAQSSELRNRKEWLKSMMVAAGLPDPKDLEKGLLLYYPFDHKPDTIYVRDPRSPMRVKTKLLNELASGAIVPGLSGQALRIKDAGIFQLPSYGLKRDAKSAMELFSGDYTIAIWCKPERLPLKEEDFSLLVGKENQRIGLKLLPDGTVVHAHPGRKKVKLRGKAITTGRWWHLAVSVSNSQGIAKLYINGKLVAQEKFTPTPPAVLKELGKIYTVVGASANMPVLRFGVPANEATKQTIEAYYKKKGKTPPAMIPWDSIPMDEQENYKLVKRLPPNHTYHGLLDELRLYERALSEQEIKAIYRLHAAFAQ